MMLAHNEGFQIAGAIETIPDYVDAVVVRMDGDGQMNPDDLRCLIDPVATGSADFAKENLFFSGKAYEVMPKLRFLATAFLSLLTKIVSGYWHLSNFQSGYVAISRKALDIVDWHQMYKRYGQPNDQLILLNVYNFKVMETNKHLRADDE